MKFRRKSEAKEQMMSVIKLYQQNNSNVYSLNKALTLVQQSV